MQVGQKAARMISASAAMSQGFAKEDTAAVCAVLERLGAVKR